MDECSSNNNAKRAFLLRHFVKALSEWGFAEYIHSSSFFHTDYSQYCWSYINYNKLRNKYL